MINRKPYGNARLPRKVKKRLRSESNNEFTASIIMAAKCILEALDFVKKRKAELSRTIQIETGQKQKSLL